ncbi:Guanine nucleotide-binding protein alpha-1 subunit [Hibiscus syriacus]|uniref:Guanine nucleotide-binding protein alpha subunit n=1 Tax=Hibiscus syriacus TaxID=106335 RepID=A0A6A2YAH2_HIBSY|nr:Guanine nucleotide-binding protein alpha-1 subunit [Hibiscus syriacus]
MGSLCSKNRQYTESDAEENAQAAEIERRIEQETEAEKHIQKLLLLGAGESGKSTILKQIRLLFQTGFDVAELKSYVSVIDANIYQTIKVRKTEKGYWRETIGNRKQVGFSTLNRELAEEIGELWKILQFKLSDANYVPTRYFEFGILEKVRVVQEYVLLQQDENARITNLFGIAGGCSICKSSYNRCGRNPVQGRIRKAAKYTDSLMWEARETREGNGSISLRSYSCDLCAAINEYDQTLFEDEQKNRMMETKELFDWVLKHHASSFLYIIYVPLNVCEWFKDYQPVSTGKQEIEHAYEFIKKKFEELYFQSTAPDRIDRVFKVYRTTALDQKVVKKTFKLVDETLRRRNLFEVGLLTSTPTLTPMSRTQVSSP